MHYSYRACVTLRVLGLTIKLKVKYFFYCRYNDSSAETYNRSSLRPNGKLILNVIKYLFLSTVKPPCATTFHWPVHRRFIFVFALYKKVIFYFILPSPTTTPLRWRSINPLRFIFYHPRSTDFEEKIEGL